MKILKNSLVVLGFCLAAATQALAAPTLVGTGTLDNANDLTIIQDGATTYEFLDLTPTYGSTVSAAVAIYSGAGFHWANGTEVAALFGAFNITYGMTDGGVFPTGAAPTDSTNLASYLGIYVPGEGYATGWLDDSALAGYHSYACVGISSACVPGDPIPRGTFVNNINSAEWPSVPNIAVFLVRNNGGLIPEPGTLTLLSVGLFGLAARRKRWHR